MATFHTKSLTAIIAAGAAMASLAACGDRTRDDNAAQTGTTIPTDPLAQPGMEGNMVGTQPQLGGQGAVGQAFTDEQINAYARAVAQVNEGRVGAGGERLVDVVRAPRAAVEQAGLTIEDFILIAAAANEDPNLRQRVQTQVMQQGMVGSAGGAGMGAGAETGTPGGGATTGPGVGTTGGPGTTGNPQPGTVQPN